jgi:hypothetical protein
MMKEGLLWYDDNPGRDLAAKIGPAVRRYRQKFGVAPNVCYVHASALASAGSPRPGGNGHERQVDGVRVAPLPSVLRHHFWVGREEKRRRWQARERYAGAPSPVLAPGDDHPFLSTSGKNI